MNAQRMAVMISNLRMDPYEAMELAADWGWARYTSTAIVGRSLLMSCPH